MLPLDSVVICVTSQRLHGYRGGRWVRSWPVSTARHGTGQTHGSEKTPLGRHFVRAMIGRDAPEGAVFVGRRATGETWSAELAASHPDRDWILTRVLWLCGTERGFNRLGDVDSMRRFIYIHGTPENAPMGTPDSHGCVRMRNTDVIELFERTRPGMPVTIIESGAPAR